MISIVTLTGADNGTNPNDLVNLSEKYAFAEWAILVQGGKSMQYGKPRWPSYDWITQLIPLYHKHQLNLSLHLCGNYVNDILQGNIDFISNDLSPFWQIFKRVQINTHGVPHLFDSDKMAELMNIYPEKEFIFQYDEVNDSILYNAHHKNVKCSALFDLSHGAGVLPAQWPQPITNIKCGYAGGISPKNVVEQINNVNSIVGDIDTWIDMETHVRSNFDQLFDLNKVDQVLSLSEPYINVINQVS